MKAKITPAAIQDIEALNKISIASKRHWNYPEEWMEKWKDDLALTQHDFSEQRIFKITEEPDSIFGFCAIKEHEHEYEIIHLWIKPAYIGKGYGKYLLNETIKQVAVKEKPIIVEADPNAEQFYSNQGFTTFSKKASYPAGRFLPLMRRKGPSIN